MEGWIWRSSSKTWVKTWDPATLVVTCFTSYGKLEMSLIAWQVLEEKCNSLDKYTLKFMEQQETVKGYRECWTHSRTLCRINHLGNFWESIMPEQRQRIRRNLLKIITFILLFSRLNISRWVFEQEKFHICLMPACPSVHRLIRIFLSYHQFKILDVAKQKWKVLSLGWALLLSLSAAASLLWLWSIVRFTSLHLTWKAGMNILPWRSTALQWWTTTFQALSVIQKILLYGRRQAQACSGLVQVMYLHWLCIVSHLFYMRSNPKVRGVMQDL